MDEVKELVDAGGGGEAADVDGVSCGVGGHSESGRVDASGGGGFEVRHWDGNLSLSG